MKNAGYYNFGATVAQLNYGLLMINWNQKPPTATTRINGDDQTT